MAGVECGMVAGATEPCTSSRLSRQGFIVAHHIVHVAKTYTANFTPG